MPIYVIHTLRTHVLEYHVSNFVWIFLLNINTVLSVIIALNVLKAFWHSVDIFDLIETCKPKSTFPHPRVRPHSLHNINLLSIIYLEEVQEFILYKIIIMSHFTEVDQQFNQSIFLAVICVKWSLEITTLRPVILIYLNCIHIIISVSYHK